MIDTPAIAKVAAIMLRSPFGRVLLCRRSDGQGWAFPAGGMEEGEDAEEAALRELWEETGYRAGHVGSIHMRRVKDGVDCTTFLREVDDEFIPHLNHEHTAWGWFSPADVLGEGAPFMPMPGSPAPPPEPILLDTKSDERADSGLARIAEALDEFGDRWERIGSKSKFGLG